MAFRIHVTTIRDSTTEAVRNTFVELLGENFANVRLTEHAGWVSFRTSVWGVSSSDLISGLRQLNKPALQFTTEDGSRWYVTIIRPDAAPESLLHEFGYHGGTELDEAYFAADDEEDEDDIDPETAFLEDEPTTPMQPRSSFDRFAEYFVDMGVPLPADLLEQAKSLSFPVAIATFQRWHQDRLIEFLKFANVTFDEPTVRQALAWEGLTEAERDSDLGNLPRLLAAIGLGGEFEAYVTEAELGEEERESDDDLALDDDDEDDDHCGASESDQARIHVDRLQQIIIAAEQWVPRWAATPWSTGPSNCR